MNLNRLIMLLCRVAVLLSVAASVHGQPAQMSCVTNVVPTILRGEGLTEAVGDVTLNCTGGTPTAPGSLVPQVNIQIWLNVNVTSRLLSDPFTEALLLIDEPTQANQRACVGGPCSILGTGAAIAYDAPAPSTIPNVYQARLAGPSSLWWNGVPVDPPGFGRQRILRFTNVKANAYQLGVSQTLVPSQVLMYISVSSFSWNLDNSPRVVGVVQPGQELTVKAAAGSTLKADLCTATSQQVLLQFQEGFGGAFRPRSAAAPANSYDTENSPPPVSQAIPGLSYHTETGFYNPALPVSNGLNRAGLADHGTRLIARFTNIPAGVSVVPSLTDSSGVRARWISTDLSGAGPFAPASEAPLANPTVVVVWEVLRADPFALETFELPVSFSYSSSSSPGVIRIAGGLAPLSTAGTATALAPMPRFAEPASRPVFTLTECRFTLLFPFVSNSPGWDTAIAISNTSLDPFGTLPERGTCTIYYYGNSGGGAPPPPQVSQAVPAGGQLVFSLAIGGNLGIAPTPGFEGYMFVTCNFHYAHALARLTHGAGPGASYLAVSLDQNLLDADGFTRTLSKTGESLGH